MLKFADSAALCKLLALASVTLGGRDALPRWQLPPADVIGFVQRVDQFIELACRHVGDVFSVVGHLSTPAAHVVLTALRVEADHDFAIGRELVRPVMPIKKHAG